MPPGLTRTCRAAAVGAALGLAAAGAATAGRIFLTQNWRTVLPGRAFRSAQLTPDQLCDRARRHGLRTVINLRGFGHEFSWYRAESRATHAADIAQEDITCSAYRLPPPNELRRLVEIFDRTDYPVLIHCRQGVDRTGLAAAVLVLLQPGATVADARRQLSLRYGHVPLRGTKVLGEFFVLYDEWLTARGVDHSPAAFRAWVTDGYCPGYCRGRLVVLARPAAVRVGTPAAVRVRAHNTSVRPWVLRPGTEAGVHVRFLMFDQDRNLVQIGRAGLFAARVEPGESVDLTLALAAPPAPGPYSVMADLYDRNQCSFVQYGGEPLEIDFQAFETADD